MESLINHQIIRVHRILDSPQFSNASQLVHSSHRSLPSIDYPNFICIMFPPTHLPVYLAQTSPLSPVRNAPPPAEGHLVFPTIQHNLRQLRQHLVRAKADLPASGGVACFPEYGLQGIIQHSPVCIVFDPRIESINAIVNIPQVAGGIVDEATPRHGIHPDRESAILVWLFLPTHSPSSVLHFPSYSFPLSATASPLHSC